MSPRKQVRELIDRLETAGVRLEVTGERLLIHGDAPPALLMRVQRHRRALLAAARRT
ncbi:hypothetical protein [Rhodospirillum centenum]|uniref:hypothetical protein n=1 Tax=Rhodospirillum centenum TaxID=34018 RepID=UPI00162251CC|nr:hypothetical protein [Rhodospirillum centenum]